MSEGECRIGMICVVCIIVKICVHERHLHGYREENGGKRRKEKESCAMRKVI